MMATFCSLVCVVFMEVKAGVRQSDGALGLTSEPPDADHAKWVPVAAQHFHSTQVNN